ncbi:aromatic compound degradation protein, partial [Cadophora sp. DSE1049]
FSRLVRLKALDGHTYYGEAGQNWETGLRGQKVDTFTGGDPWDEKFQLSGKKAIVGEEQKVLCPLEKVPIILGIGLNYRTHAEECGWTIPSFPLVFTKFADCRAGPFEDIPIHPEAHELDYEGEFSVVIGKDAKNVSKDEDPLDYVLGFTVGNDMSSRYWQDPERSSSQHSTAKSFDKFAPLGPVIASLKAVGDPEKLRLRTWVNGELRQDTSTGDLIFGVRHLIRHLSRGKTLRKGTVIMTGTPSGVAAFHKPPKWLRNGDLVEIEIEKI